MYHHVSSPIRPGSSPARELTLHDIESAEIDRRRELAIPSVKVWRRIRDANSTNSS
jgi:hypothetical protein